ncbi:unnamed protein product, partial [marine sediment metagenome]
IWVVVFGNQASPSPGACLQLQWYSEDNGWTNSNPRLVARLNLINLPGLPYSPPGWGSGWQLAIDFQMMGWHWTLDGNDLDGDGLVDFGYSYWFYNVPEGTSDLGSTCGAYAPIGDEDGGAEDGFEVFGDPNRVTYYGIYGSVQYCQKLHGGGGGSGGCPNAGTTPPGVLDYCWTDIYPPCPNADCIVNISDLGQLLPNYNVPGTFTYFQGDVYPKYFGDGVVDIRDLGQMLAQYADDCN